MAKKFSVIWRRNYLSVESSERSKYEIFQSNEVAVFLIVRATENNWTKQTERKRRREKICNRLLQALHHSTNIVRIR